MSSSLPKKRLASEPTALPKTLTCPDCGAKTLRKVKSDCQLLDGTIIKKLERFQCSSCQEDFFDDAAMKEIHRQRGKKAKT